MKKFLQEAFQHSQQFSQSVQDIKGRIDAGIKKLNSEKSSIKENLNIVDEVENGLKAIQENIDELKTVSQSRAQKDLLPPDLLQKTWKEMDSSLQKLAQLAGKRRAELQVDLSKEKENEQKQKSEAAAKVEAENKAVAEAKAKKEAEAKAKAEAESKAKAEAEAKAKAEAEAKAKAEAEAKLKAAAEAKSKVDIDAKSQAEKQEEQNKEREKIKNETESNAKSQQANLQKFLNDQAEVVKSITSIKSSVLEQTIPESSSESFVVQKSYIDKAISDHQNRNSDINDIKNKIQSVISSGKTMIAEGKCIFGINNIVYYCKEKNILLKLFF